MQTTKDEGVFFMLICHVSGKGNRRTQYAEVTVILPTACERDWDKRPIEIWINFC